MSRLASKRNESRLGLGRVSFPSPTKAKFAAPWARLLEEAGLGDEGEAKWWVFEDDQWWFISS